jgi:hypothetical protein
MLQVFVSATQEARVCNLQDYNSSAVDHNSLMLFVTKSRNQFRVN